MVTTRKKKRKAQADALRQDGGRADGGREAGGVLVLPPFPLTYGNEVRRVLKGGPSLSPSYPAVYG